LTDNELIHRYLESQNQLWFSELYWRYASKVFGKCISILRDEPMARDATQDIFIKILLNLSKFSEQSSFSTWLYSISYNYCIDLIRKRKKDALIFTEDMGKIGNGKDVEIPDSMLLEMKTSHLQQVLDVLPPGDRAILLMKYQDDLSIRDMSDALDKTESAIKMQIMRAKAKAHAVYEDLFKNNPDAADTWLAREKN
jgi:RNA polymerase sigma factor (sigma-70 family)